MRHDCLKTPLHNFKWAYADDLETVKNHLPSTVLVNHSLVTV